MGSLVKVESSTYTKDVIDIFSSNKVGQYSKYLSLTPEFVTYYSVNQIMSRTDVGTGSVVSERGYNSPLRFNKIKNLPVFNLPVFSPDVTFDESGMDLEMDINDVVLLPDTVKPTVPDYLLYTLPEGRQLLFRVHNFRYNTIQSNDYVYVSLELKDIGDDLESQMEPQVVKTFYTVFENIGTEDKCFIEEEAIETVNSLVDLITECADVYRNNYWDECVGGYVLASNEDATKVIYDVFLTYFINNTDIFPHRDTTLTTLPYLDFVPNGSEALYRRSLLYAIQNKTHKLLVKDLYYFLGIIKSPFSPFQVFHYNAMSVNLQILPGGVGGSDLKPYYDGALKQSIILGLAQYPTWPPITEDDDEGDSNSDESNNQNTNSSDQLPNEAPGTESGVDPDRNGRSTGSEILSGTNAEGSPVDTIIPSPGIKPSVIVPANRIYDEFESEPIKKPTELVLTNEDKRQMSLLTEAQKYIFNLIIQYMSNTTAQVDFDTVIQILVTKGRFGYFYGPLIVYILRKTYDAYFIKSTSETD